MTSLALSASTPIGRPLEALRGIVPIASVLALVLIDLAALPGVGPAAAGPLVCLAGIFFWTIRRPDLFGIGSTFLVCLLLDLGAGLPPGLTALAVFSTRLMLLAPRRFLVGRSFAVVWAWFSLAAALCLGLRWLAACLFWQQLFDFRPTAFEIVLTVAVYPLVSFVLGRAGILLPRLPRAPGS